MNAVVPLPSIADARLPTTYEAAKHALSECSRIDECKDWADKAQALASYAKQAKDDSLRKMAERIQARAIRRCGELLKQVESATGNHLPNIKRDAAVPFGREQAATDAGLSERQRKTALRIASIPDDQFTQAVESDSPPTITELADLGTQKKPLVDLEGIDPHDYARATEAQGTLRRFADFCERQDPTRIAHAYKPHEIQKLRQCVQIIDHWLDRFITNLPE